ncbi:MAG: hypothetical protein JW955_12775 [Sedimentisphaerales bacterium]|nr:hypothetical protein [Sedimentisphaerales bacterium]
MEQPDACKGCSEARTCATVYEQVGKTGGPSVAFKALIAFLLPIATFAGTLAACGAFLRGVVTPRYETPLAFLVALAVTTALMLFVHAVTRRAGRGK